MFGLLPRLVKRLNLYNAGLESKGLIEEGKSAQIMGNELLEVEKPLEGLEQFRASNKNLEQTRSLNCNEKQTEDMRL